MATDRENLIELLKRAIAGGEVTNDDLDNAVADPKELDKIERTAWHMLSHWADDDDIRARDVDYADMQRSQLGESLSDLEALEAGYEPQEVEWGDHQANRVPLFGCLFTIGIVVLILYLMFTNGFFMHGD